MKAIDYYNRDHAAVFSSPDQQAGITIAKKLVKEFMLEAQDIIKTRKITTNRALISVMNEQNQKWNALVRLYKKNHGASPVLKDGFLRFYELLMKKEKGENKSEGS